MIDIRDLETVLLDQQEELEEKKHKKFCYRKEEELIDLKSPQAQVVIGVRRCGKSTLCLNALTHAKVKFAYVNFDDERISMLNALDLNPMLEVLYKINGSFTHLFLDEIQNIEGWQLFVNRLLRRDIRIIITGSNSKLLSSELATHLTGRHAVIRLFPFSFREFCECKDIDADGKTTRAVASRRALFDEYLMQGGFPELMHIKNKREYISELTENILQRDIVDRYKVRHPVALVKLANHIMNIAPAQMVYTNLSADMGITSSHTTQTYASYLQQAFLVQFMHRFSSKSRSRLVADKAYCIDPALMDQRPDAFSGQNLGWRLETVIYIELCRRCLHNNLDIYYLSDARRECDFIICRGNQVIEAIQVSYDISNAKTRKREINGLLFAADKTRCNKLTLITDHEYDDLTENEHSIAIRPAHEWLLNL